MPPKKKQSLQDSIQQFYNDLISNKKSPDDLKSELLNLFKKPKKDRGVERPKNTNLSPEYEYQSDVLYLPEDPTGNKYILVVVDTADGKTDAEPMTDLNSTATLKAYKAILKRNVIKIPKYALVTDNGSEFKGDFAKYVKSITLLRYIKPYRTKQVGYAESRNLTIAKALFYRMTAQQILTGKIDKHWVDDLPFAIKAINSHTKDIFDAKKKNINKLTKKGILTTKDNEQLLPIDAKVRIILDKPKEAGIEQTSKAKLSGRFRATDPRWNDNIYYITNYILSDGLPPLYQVRDENNNLVHAGFTKNELQVIDDDEKAPEGKLFIRGDPDQYIIEKILEYKKLKNGSIEYKVKWKGFPESEATWETEGKLGNNKVLTKYKEQNGIIDQDPKQIDKQSKSRGRKAKTT